MRPASYNALKKKWETDIALIAAASGIKKRLGPPPYRMTFVWHEPDRRRDPDNVDAGGRKIVLDALRASGVIPGDDSRYIRGLSADFVYPGDRAYGGPGAWVCVDGPDALRGFFIPHRLPGLNDLLAARELGARRHKGRAARARRAA